MSALFQFLKRKAVKSKKSRLHRVKKHTGNSLHYIDNYGENEMPGYKHYPEKEDIYVQGKKEADLDPEDTSTKKVPVIDTDDFNEGNLELEVMGTSLDVPGSELDDEMEEVGSEDEENNYYSMSNEDRPEGIEKDRRD